MPSIDLSLNDMVILLVFAVCYVSIIYTTPEVNKRFLPLTSLFELEVARDTELFLKQSARLWWADSIENIAQAGKLRCTSDKVINEEHTFPYSFLKVGIVTRCVGSRSVVVIAHELREAIHQSACIPSIISL